METVLKPALEHVEIIPVDGPGGRYTVPSVELRFEDFPAHLLQMTECFLFGVIWGKQINRGLSSQVGQRQLGVGGIRAMQPLQKRLCRHPATIDVQRGRPRGIRARFTSRVLDLRLSGAPL